MMNGHFARSGMIDQRVTLEPGWLLHAVNYRDSSLLVQLMTPGHGRVSAVARGARSPRSRRRALLQPFRPLLVSWVGRSSLKTLTTVEESGRSHPLVDESLACGWYATELLMRLCAEGEAQLDLFAAYGRLLERLEQVDQPGQVDAAQLPAQMREQALRRFERSLLYTQGWWPQFDELANKVAEPLPSAGYDVGHGEPAWLDPIGTGLYYGQQRSPADPAVRKPVLTALASGNFSDPALGTELKQIMRALINVHLGGVPLKSRQVLVELRRAANRNKEPGSCDER